MVRTRVWLALVSIMMPSVSGWFDSAEKYLMVCGLPSSNTSKSSLVRLGISMPCLSFTLKNRLTTLTCALKVCNGSSLAGACDCWSWAGAGAGGFWDCAAIQALAYRMRPSAVVKLANSIEQHSFSFRLDASIVVHRYLSASLLQTATADDPTGTCGHRSGVSLRHEVPATFILCRVPAIGRTAKIHVHSAIELLDQRRRTGGRR